MVNAINTCFTYREIVHFLSFFPWPYVNGAYLRPLHFSYKEPLPLLTKFKIYCAANLLYVICAFVYGLLSATFHRYV